jgi:hypothetical protein
MHLKRTLVVAAVGVALALSAIPANAQRRGGRGGTGAARGGGGSGGAAHGGPARAGAGRAMAGPRGAGVGRDGSVPRGRVAGPYSRGSYGPRGAYGYGGGYRYGSGYDYRDGYGYRGGYYSFRPRLSLGFGLWMGYPVAYPYYYGYPYGYAYPYPADPYAYGNAVPSYGYPAQPYPSPNQSSPYPPSNYPSSVYPEYGSSGQGYPAQQPAPSVGVRRGGQQSAPGGVSFEITPDTAAVFVDGTYVGTAGNFGPTSQPLGLISGRHHIEIRASGYRTMTFDVDVTSGQVIPYQGTLQQN